MPKNTWKRHLQCDRKLVTEREKWHLIPNGINPNKWKSFFIRFCECTCNPLHAISKTGPICLTWHKVVMLPLKSDHVSSVYLHFPFIQTVMFESFTWYFESLSLLYRRGFIIVKAKFRWTKPFENVMHLYLPTRLYCLSLLLDQKLQVNSNSFFFWQLVLAIN